MYNKQCFLDWISYMRKYHPEFGERIDLAETLLAFEPIGDLWADASRFFDMTGRIEDMFRFGYKVNPPATKKALIKRLKRISEDNDATHIDFVNRSVNIESFLIPNLEIEVIGRILSAKDNGAPRF